MTFKELKQKIKEEQKILAQLITNGKIGRKPKNRTEEVLEDYRGLDWNRDHYRHNHIVYCNMFNGTPYEKIENPREGNGPSTYELDRIRSEWESQLDEAVRDSS